MYDLLTWLWLIAAWLSIGSNANPVVNISALKPWDARHILRKLIVRGHGQICKVDYQEHVRQTSEANREAYGTIVLTGNGLQPRRPRSFL